MSLAESIACAANTPARAVNGQVWMEGWSNRVDFPGLMTWGFITLFAGPIILAAIV